MHPSPLLDDFKQKNKFDTKTYNRKFCRGNIRHEGQPDRILTWRTNPAGVHNLTKSLNLSKWPKLIKSINLTAKLPASKFPVEKIGSGPLPPPQSKMNARQKICLKKWTWIFLLFFRKRLRTSFRAEGLEREVRIFGSEQQYASQAPPLTNGTLPKKSFWYVFQTISNNFYFFRTCVFFFFLQTCKLRSAPQGYNVRLG